MKNQLMEGITHSLNTLNPEGAVIELRVLSTPRGTQSGYYNDMSKMADDAAPWDGFPVYTTLNPVKPELLSRVNNRLVDHVHTTTSDNDIERRRWILLDFDPVRPSGISSSDEEHEAALDCAKKVRQYLITQGWPEPLLADSGNGAHLLYRIDMPNNEVSTKLIKNILLALCQQSLYLSVE